MFNILFVTIYNVSTLCKIPHDDYYNKSLWQAIILHCRSDKVVKHALPQLNQKHFPVTNMSKHVKIWSLVTIPIIPSQCHVLSHICSQYVDTVSTNTLHGNSTVHFDTMQVLQIHGQGSTLKNAATSPVGPVALKHTGPNTQSCNHQHLNMKPKTFITLHV